MNMLHHEHILNFEMALMKQQITPTLNQYAIQDAEIFTSPSQSTIHKITQVAISNYYSIPNDNNSNLKAFSVALLRIIFQSKNTSLCDHIKCCLYSNDIDLTLVDNRPYPTLTNNNCKKLLVETFQMLKYGNYQNKIYIKLSKYPIIIQLFVMFLRSVLKCFNIENCLDFHQPLETNSIYQHLIDFMDLDCLRLNNLYLFKDDQILLYVNNHSQFIIANYQQIKLDTNVTNTHLIEDDDDVLHQEFALLRNDKEIVTPYFQVVESQNHFLKKKSGIYHKDNNKNITEPILEQLEKCPSIDRVKLWNQPFIESGSEDQEKQHNQANNKQAKCNKQLIIHFNNPQLIQKSKLIQSIQFNEKQIKQIIDLKYTESKKQSQQSEDQKVQTKQIKKWFPNKNNFKTESMRIATTNEPLDRILTLTKKNTIDSQYFNYQSHSTSFEVNNKGVKNTLNSKIVNISFVPSHQFKQKNQQPIQKWKKIIERQQQSTQKWKKQIQQNNKFVKKVPTFIFQDKYSVNPPKSQYLTEKPSTPKLAPQRFIHRVAGKSPIQYSNRSTNRIQFKPKVSFIYGQTNKLINRPTAIKSVYNPERKI